MAMKKIKVSEATNLQLDWLVAKCEHDEAVFLHRREPLRIVHKNGLPVPAINDPEGDQFSLYLEYTSDPAQMWPIIEREDIAIGHGNSQAHPDNRYEAVIIRLHPWAILAQGPTKLIAAARCFVVSRLGEIAEVPDDL